MAFFIPVVYALGGMLIRAAAKKTAEKLAQAGAKKLTKKAAEELVEQGTKITKATTKNVDKVISTAKSMEKGLQGLRDRGGPRGFAQRYQPPTVQLRPSDIKPTPSLGRGIRSGADDFKFAEVIPPKGGKSPKLQGPKIRKDADDAVAGDLSVFKPRVGVAPYPLVTRIASELRRALDSGETLVEIKPILDEMEKIEMPSLGSDAEAGEPPTLDTTPDASLQRDDERFDAMGEETEVMESEPSFDSFGEAFSYYRRQKRVPTFMYKGNLYTTRFKEETVPQHKKLFNVTGSYAEDYQSRTGV
tara:strand:+ start:1643 stop:2548 length:906 start_codon:yes stop_codon:yes gene_type:complete